MHLRSQFADVRQERLAVESAQSDLMQHQVVDRGVGKAEKNLVGYGFRQLIVIKQIRQQPISVVPADRTQDHINFRIPEGRQQILRSFFRMIPDVFHPLQRMGHEPHIQAVFLQPSKADLHFKLHKGLSHDPAGKAHDRNTLNHCFPPGHKPCSSASIQNPPSGAACQTGSPAPYRY